jgi:hypothetical protein
MHTHIAYKVISYISFDINEMQLLEYFECIMVLNNNPMC